MIVYTHEVSHQWKRRVTLREVQEGSILLHDVCDADFLLRAAAEHHGVDAPYPCPICGEDALRLVTWVYGDNLGRRSGSARSEEEIAEMVREVGDIDVHTVEVCPRCKWNYLLKQVTATQLV